MNKDEKIFEDDPIRLLFPMNMGKDVHAYHHCRTEYCLSGRIISNDEGYICGFCNRIIPEEIMKIAKFIKKLKEFNE
jgi:hypothetical protein